MDPDKISRMPEKRPYPLYLSPCTSDKTTKYSLNDLSNSATSKLTFQIQKVNGQRYVVAKKVIKPSCTPFSSESSAPLHNNSSLGEGSNFTYIANYLQYLINYLSDSPYEDYLNFYCAVLMRIWRAGCPWRR